MSARMTDEEWAPLWEVVLYHDRYYGFPPLDPVQRIGREARRARESEAALEREISISLRPALSLSMATAERASERIAALEADKTALLKALEKVKTALGDRLLAEGPLSLPYAHGVMREINAAIAKAEAP